MLRGDAGDLAGHHLVLKVSKDSWTGSKYMQVDRVQLVVMGMLADDGAADSAVHLYSESGERGCGIGCSFFFRRRC